MIRLGLTGSIGMGKSAVARMFVGARVPLFDADAEVRRLQGPGSALLARIESLFPGVLDVGGLDRQALARRVFGDAAALARLEGLVHPAVAEARQAFLHRHRFQPLVVLDVPLLFEKNGARNFDAVAVVSAPAAIQRRRVLARPGMTEARLSQILKLQLPDPEKRRRADFVIGTGAPLAVTRRQVLALIACLRARGVRYCRTCARSSSTPRPPA